MKSIAPQASRSFLAAIAALLLISVGLAQKPPSDVESKPDRPLHLLVLGDSISWGEGLKDEHKTWYLVKSWLEQNAGREVHELVEAHSGAFVGSPGESRPSAFTPFDGELSRAYPTVNDQLDSAIKNYANPEEVDLVLVNGCINDIDFRRLLDAANTPDHIGELARAKCGAPVENLLTRITETFPAAHVIITGYYPIVSEKTPNDLFIRALAKRFYRPDPGAPKLNDKALRARLIAISREWYQTSYQMLSTAARNVDTKLAAKGSRQRVLFADAGFEPEHSFAARESRLWGFDASALRKMLVVFTLGRVQLRANDERRSYRSELCEGLFLKPANETTQEKAIREDGLMRCRLAAVGHPNRKGAAMYADAIGRLLKPLIAVSGSMKNSRPDAAVSSPLR